MANPTEGSTAVCAECRKESVIDYVGNYDGVFGCVLSCNHRNAYCTSCEKLARDVSDTSKEVHVFCDNCFDASYLYDPYEIEERTNRNSKSRARKPPVDELRKEHHRAYFEWSEDESIAVGLFINKLPFHKLSALFEREPNAVKFSRSLKSKEPISGESAIRFLGRIIECNSCSHHTMLTYRHLDLISEKKAKRVLKLTLTDVYNSLKCKDCGLKNFTLSK